MPLYEYACSCGTKNDISHPMAESPNITCPNCHKQMHKGFGAPLVNFKGEGFYSTDKKNDR